MSFANISTLPSSHSDRVVMLVTHEMDISENRACVELCGLSGVAHCALCFLIPPLDYEVTFLPQMPIIIVALTSKTHSKISTPELPPPIYS